MSHNLYREEIILAAIAWWRGLKPLSYSHEEHLKNPCVNVTKVTEFRMAKAVGLYLSASFHHKKRRTKK